MTRSDFGTLLRWAGLHLLLLASGDGFVTLTFSRCTSTRTWQLGLSAANNEDDKRSKAAGAAAGAVAGGLIAGPVGAVIGFAVGDMMSSNKPKQQSTDPTAVAAQKLSMALEDAKSVAQSLDTVIEQRVKDMIDLNNRKEALQSQAREFLLANNEAAARKCLEQKLGLSATVKKLETLVSEDRARRQGVEVSMSRLMDRIAEYESMLLDKKITNLEETTTSSIDPLEERFRKLERE